MIKYFRFIYYNFPRQNQQDLIRLTISMIIIKKICISCIIKYSFISKINYFIF